MTQLLAERPAVSDLRGSAVRQHGSAVLEDPTGRRRRRLRLLGRLVAFVLTLWLIALVLGGIGLSPVSGIPFVQALRPASPPPAAKHLPTPTPGTAADLQSALPAGTHSTATTRPAAIPQLPSTRVQSRRPATNKHAAASPRSVTVHTMTPNAQGPAATTPAATAPGTTTTHPNNGRHTGTSTGTATTTTPTTTGTSTAPGRSGTAPGNSGSAPGQTHKQTATTTG